MPAVRWRTAGPLVSIALALLVAGCASDGTLSPPKHALAEPVLISAAATSEYQLETTLARSGNRIVVVWIGTLQPLVTTIEYAVSDDAGTTWSAPARIPIPSPSLGLSDPGVVADDAGNFTLVALGVGSEQAVYVFRLTAGGTTFGAPVTVDRLAAVANHFDKTLIARTGSGYLVTYSVIGTSPAGIAATSTDGTTWQHDTIATNSPAFIVPCASGQSVVAAYIRNTRGGGLFTATSNDGGRTWSPPAEVDAAAPASLSNTPACARRGDEVWVLASSATSDLHLFRSTNGGATFVAMPTVTPGVPYTAAYGQLSIRNDGTVDLGYYESSEAVPFGFVHALLPPGATAFQPREIVRDHLHQTAELHGIQSYADYVGMIPGAIVFTDNSSGVSHIAFFREAVP